jgi:hypothetical protein
MASTGMKPLTLPHAPLTPLDPVHRPTDVNLRLLTQEINANAQSVETMLRAGHHGQQSFNLKGNRDSPTSKPNSHNDARPSTWDARLQKPLLGRKEKKHHKAKD